jgi:phage anti-repressor protein
MELDGLEDFLINESKINKEFIKDFFGMQKKNIYDNYKPFIIDLDDIAYWLDSKKSRLKKSLIKSYENNIDYIVIPPIKYSNVLLSPKEQQNENRGGHNRKSILLTVDCFKMLCMRSNTKKANKVRQYYIDLEKLIDQYKDIIINNQTKKIEILENDLRKDVLPKEDYCYIYLEKDELGIEYYRLGQTGNLQKRFHNHNSSSIHKKIVAYKIKTDNIIHFEACLRGVMFDFRYKNDKDYFKLPKEKIEESLTLCKKVVKNFKNNNILEKKGGSKNNGDNLIIDYNNVDKVLIKIFSFLSHSVMWNMYDNPNNAYFNGKKITKQKLKEIILPETEINKLLIVSVHRYDEFTEVINLGFNELSYEDLFNILYKYYNKEKIDLKFIKKIPDDIDYYKENAINKIKLGDKVYRINLIGTLCRFENVKHISKNIYKLILGS